MSERAHHYTSDDGLTLYCRDFAANANGGVTALCLPGLTRNSRDFIALAHHLQPQRRVLCPDLRGRGHSDRDPEWKNYQPPVYVRDTWTLLDGLEVQRVVIIGTSLGGLMAMVMAVQQPERVAGIILNDVGPEIAPEGLERIRGYVGETPSAQNWDEAVARTRAVYGQALPDLDEAGWQAYARQGWREDAHGVPRPDYDAGIGRAIREASGEAPDPWPMFRALQCPTLVLRGAYSDILSEAILARMHTELPALQSETIPGRGHVPLLDEPPSLTAIDAFLAGIDASK